MFKSTALAKYSLVALCSLSACATAPPKLVTPILCEFAIVLVGEAEVPLLEAEFGPEKGSDSPVCKAIGIALTGDESGASEPALIEAAAKLDVPLADGSLVEVTLVPATSE